MNKKKIGIVISTLIMMLIMVLVGPVDIFTHGYFCEEIECGQIAMEDLLGNIDLANQEYEVVFSPKDKHFAGFEIYLINQPDGNTGNLNMEIFDEDDKKIDTIQVDLSKVHAAIWYKVYTNVNFSKDKNYILKIKADKCNTIPYLQLVQEDYLPDETVEGNILLSYAYEKPTFTFQNKLIIFIFVISIWLFIISQLTDVKVKKLWQLVAGVCFMAGILTWNYMYNSMDNQNKSFEEFQADSETLVAGVIYAEENGVYFEKDDEQGFGMGRYYDLKGKLTSYNKNYITDDNWLQGYSRTESAIAVDSNICSEVVAVTGNYILFENEEVYQITNVENEGSNIVIYLNAKKILTSAKNGNLDKIQFYDANLQPLAKGRVTAYKSQYGLNGKIFRHMARYMGDEHEISTLNLVCSMLTAAVFSLIVLLLSYKYNKLMAGCFFVVFWLSPWIVNFARNLYWVEFTWFVPMLVGLFCAWRIDDRKCRLISYAAAFVSIFIKCLCGYEYLSAIMLGLISFLSVDMFTCAVKKDKEKSILLLRTIIIIGVIALIGFIAAVCVHAPLKGNGSIIEGIKNIFEQDVLRRTVGGDLNGFDEKDWSSLNASVWETYSKYFHFNTEVIAGITGNLFPILCIIPLSIFGYDYSKKNLNIELLAMYVMFFLTAVSWFFLAKGHSYEHTHMNYVLWYFGFIQICIYIIVNKITTVIGHKGDVR